MSELAFQNPSAEQFSTSPDKVAGIERLNRHAERLRKIGSSITAFNVRRTSANALSDHRQERHAQKKAGLKSALGERKQMVKQAKADLKFAEKGYSFSQRRFEKTLERVNQEKKMLKERGLMDKGGIFERMANRLERKAIKRQAKANAEAVISQREKDARDAHEETSHKLDLARARRAQTRGAYWRSKAHIGGNKSNFISTYGDVMKTQDQRLADLKSRDKFNKDYMQQGEMNADKVRQATENIPAFQPEQAVLIEPTPSVTAEHPLEEKPPIAPLPRKTPGQAA